MKLIVESYLRSLLATSLAAVFAVGKLPVQFDGSDWLAVANAIWVASIPTLIRLLNPNDTAFGLKKEGK